MCCSEKIIQTLNQQCCKTILAKQEALLFPCVQIGGRKKQLLSPTQRFVWLTENKRSVVFQKKNLDVHNILHTILAQKDLRVNGTITPQGTKIFHLGKRKIIFKRALGGDMLVPRVVIYPDLVFFSEHFNDISYHLLQDGGKMSVCL